MATQIVTGKMVGVVDGPAMLLEVRGQEMSFPVAMDLSLDWVQAHLEASVTVLVRDGRIVQIG